MNRSLSNISHTLTSISIGLIACAIFLTVVRAANQAVLAALPPIKTVFLILMENYPWSAVRGYPYISKLTSQLGESATQYFKPPGTALLSLPNYIWLEAGDTLGVTTDDDPSAISQTTTSHLTTQLTTAGISWKEYAEDISGTNCPLTDSGKYAVRHDPFVYFTDITDNNNPSSANCIAHIRPYAELASDLAKNTISRYNFITPNLCDDMHDKCSSDQIGQGDTWLSQQIPIIMNSEAYQDGGAIFITWDNSDYSTTNPIGMIVLSPYMKAAGYSNSIHYDHSSLLKTLEEIFGVRLIRAAADPAINDLSDFFTASPNTLIPTAIATSTPTQASLSASTSRVTTITIDLTHPAGTSTFGTGATHTQDSEEAYFNGYPSAATYYQTALYYQNILLMGWGISDPEPSPRSYDFSTQDAHVQLMQQTGAHSIFSFCCAPGWMRPAGYQDEWTYLDTAPDPTHVADFANLSALAAQRYPGIQNFQVWNELKGMWGTDPGCTPSVCGQNRWDYERYTSLYNAVWDAVKAVRPDAKLGGPYVVMEYQYDYASSTVCGTYGCIDQRDLDAITYWLANKHGADYIVLDGGPNDQGNNDFDASYFSSIVNWIRQQPNGGATLPIVWAEWYPAVSQLNGNLDYYNAVYGSDAMHTIQAGIQWGLMWGTTGGVGGQIPETARPELMLDSTGNPTKVYNTTFLLKANFPPGTQWYDTTVSPATVTVLASSRKTMLVNQLNAIQTVRVNGTQLSLLPYEVKVIDTPGAGSAPIAAAGNFVQGNIGSSTSLVSTQTVSFTSAVTTGDTVALAASGWNSTNTASVTNVTDNFGNVYKKAVEEMTDTSNPLSVWYATSVKGGSGFKVTATYGGASQVSVGIHEYSGVSAMEGAQHRSGTGTDANTGTVTTNAPTKLLFGAFNFDEAVVVNGIAGTGYVLRESQPDGNTYVSLFTEDRTVSAAGQYSASLTFTSSVTWRGIVVALH